jgi:hypothetical protein
VFNISEPIKDGRRWCHRIMVDGKRITGTFDTKAAALKWEAHQLVALSSGPTITVTKTCADAYKRYEIEV